MPVHACRKWRRRGKFISRISLQSPFKHYASRVYQFRISCQRMCRCVNSHINLTEAIYFLKNRIPLPRIDIVVNNKFKWQHSSSTSIKLLVQCLPHTPFRVLLYFIKFSSFPSSKNYRTHVYTYARLRP